MVFLELTVSMITCITDKIVILFIYCYNLDRIFLLLEGGMLK